MMTSAFAVTLSEMSLKQQKSKLKLIFCNIYSNLHAVIMIYGFDDVIIVFVTSQPQKIYF